MKVSRHMNAKKIGDKDVCVDHRSQQIWQKRGNKSVEVFFKMAEICLALGRGTPTL